MSEQVHPERASSTLEFDPHDPSITASNLHEIYDDLRSGCPVSRGSKYGGYWLLTRYDDVRAAALDADTFSSAHGVYLPAVSEERFPLLEMDDPEHRAYRKVLASRFNNMVAKRWEPRIREIVNELVDSFVDRGEADLVADFAEPLPLTVIGEVFGLSPENRAQVRKDAFDFLACASGSPDAAEALERMLSRWERLAAERREEPADDLLTSLTQANFGEWDGSDRLIARLMFTLSFGGHDTTILVLGSMLLHLARNPEQRRQLIDDPSLIPAAVEELLRLYAPLHNFRRDATRDTTVGGREIQAGDPVLLGWGAANRDPEKFPDPAKADFTRPNARDHLTFGAGTHACIGQFIARVELVTALDVVLARLGEYELAGEPTVTGLTGGGHHHGVEHLPVRFTAGPR
ncbi:cytochrome P450 [Streptosporangium sp. NPDC051022]|uniref:cytochrome P450 n=1 Tax=Streptosporangium sp. NPDC051022 TaxID=3155752 RepID=UPI003430A37A